MLKIFIGYDPRSPLAYNVLQHSIVRHASKPVSITPLILSQLPIKRRGLTEFTYSRFIVPYLCDYKGSAVFMDADMIVTGDITELFKLADYQYGMQVVKNQPKFEFPSMILFNNSLCGKIKPETIDDETFNPFKMDFVPVGELPDEWNHCVSYVEPKESKLYHYTQGIPYWHETSDCFAADLWLKEFELMKSSCSWKDLMASSVHAQPVVMRLLQRYGMNVECKQ